MALLLETPNTYLPLFNYKTKKLYVSSSGPALKNNLWGPIVVAVAGANDFPKVHRLR